MAISTGLKTALNNIRETSIEENTLYHKYVDEILDTTDIGSFGNPILEHPKVMNEFISSLVQRIAYTQVTTKLYNNPLKVLEGDTIPLGSIGQEIFINPAKGRKFNVDDFAGLLAKYESDIKVEYAQVNSDLQYPVTITKAKLKNAFTSWSTLENFINGITQSLYNGAYIDQYNLTKGLISSAYKSNQAQIEIINEPNTESLAEQFIIKARTIFLNMQTPTPNFNAWRKIGGYGRDVMTWSNPQDIVFLIRNDIASYLDVELLSKRFNVPYTTLLGNVIYVNDFDMYDNSGEKIFDGSKIVGIIADKSWFRIGEQDNSMDEFYNANNRTWQFYLNITKLYSYRYCSNAVIFATEAPQTTITGIDVPSSSYEIDVDEDINVTVTTTPFQANNPEITFTKSNNKVDITSTGKTVTITGKTAGDVTITATAGNVTKTFTVTVKASE